MKAVLVSPVRNYFWEWTIWHSDVPACVADQLVKRMRLGDSDDQLFTDFRKYDRHVLLVKGHLIYLPITIFVDEMSHRYLRLKTTDMAINYLSEGTVYGRLLIHSIGTGCDRKFSFGFCRHEQSQLHTGICTLADNVAQLVLG